MSVNVSFYDLYYDAARLCKISSDSNALTIAKIIANQIIEEVANKRDWYFLNEDWYIQTSNRKYEYSMPASLQKIISMWSVDRDMPILKGDDRQYSKADPNPSSAGSPYFYLEKRYGPYGQPHTPITFVSDDASDNGTLTLYGYSYGREVSETITIDGTTSVDSVYEYSLVTKIVPNSSGFTGIITVTAFSGGVSVTSVAAGSTSTVTSVTQPNTAITLTSSVGATDEGKNVVVEGITHDTGLIIAEAGTLDSSGVYTTTETFGKILNIVKENTTGSVIATDANGNTLWQAGPYDQSVQHLIVGLVNPPDSTETLRIRFKRKVNKLVNDYDPVPVPAQYIPYIQHLLMARLYDFMGQQDTKANKEEALWREGLKEMISEDSKHSLAPVQTGRGEHPATAEAAVARNLYPWGGYTVQSG